MYGTPGGGKGELEWGGPMHRWDYEHDDESLRDTSRECGAYCPKCGADRSECKLTIHHSGSHTCGNGHRWE